MRKLAVGSLLALLLILLIPFASGAEVLGISPGCIQPNGQECSYYSVMAGQEESFELHVFNLMDGERTFSMKVERGLVNNTEFTPNTFALSNKYEKSIAHQGCLPEEGCQVVYATVNTKGLTPGKYETVLIASTSFSEQGSLALNAEVGSRLLIEIQENSFYKFIRILKENIIIILAAIVLIAAALFILFKKQILEFAEKKNASKIYKQSKEKRKK